MQLLMALAPKHETVQRLLGALLDGMHLSGSSTATGQVAPRLWERSAALCEPDDWFALHRTADGETVLLPGAAIPARRDDKIPTAGALAALLEASRDDAPDEDGVWARTSDGAWSRVQDATARIARNSKGWEVTGPDRREPVDGLVLVDGDRRLRFPAHTDLGDLFGELNRRTTGMPEPMRVRTVRLGPVDATNWVGIRGAEARTRDRAVALVGERAGTPDESAARTVVGEITRPGSWALRRDTLRRLAGRVGVADLERVRHGRQAVALLLVENEIERRVAGEPGDTVCFADALTAFAADRARATRETNAIAVNRIRNLVESWLTGQPRGVNDTGLRLRESAVAADADAWEQLCTAAPWVAWLAPEDDGLAVALTAAGMVDVLTVLRPRQVLERIQTAGTVGWRLVVAPLPARWSAVYRITDAAPSLAELDGLAASVETLLGDPAETARRAQEHRLSPPLQHVLDERMGQESADQAGLDDLLVVHDQGGTARVVLVNRSPRGRLPLVVDGEAVTLGPFAAGHARATGYVSLPLATAATLEVSVGADTRTLVLPDTRLDPPVSVTASDIPTELFRGRAEELAVLSSTLEGPGPRVGSLVHGTRRAGKSTLANEFSRRGERGAVWLDLGDTPTTVADFGGWQASVTRQLRRSVRRHLGLTLPAETTDLVELLQDLDDALDGGPPVPVVLDELDVLLLPEQGSDGRRTAGRLGAQTFTNLALVGTVQRFHRSVHEFKIWQSVHCPADLTWSDGVSYFLGPLADDGEGLTVRGLSRAAVSPRDFAEQVHPVTGLRPYFWAQLRYRLEGEVRADPGAPRLCGTGSIRRHLETLATADPHLSLVLDTDTELTAEERRRQDRFSEGERRILCLFAQTTGARLDIGLESALEAGGQAAVDELLDRDYLTWGRPGHELRTAVPVYLQYLRAHVTDLLAVTPDAPRLVPVEA
ncbi:hypothetical protein [Geodermatophilus sp. SYSU D01119]